MLRKNYLHAFSFLLHSTVDISTALSESGPDFWTQILALSFILLFTKLIFKYFNPTFCFGFLIVVISFQYLQEIFYYYCSDFFIFYRPTLYLCIGSMLSIMVPSFTLKSVLPLAEHTVRGVHQNSIQVLARRTSASNICGFCRFGFGCGDWLVRGA